LPTRTDALAWLGIRRQCARFAQQIFFGKLWPFGRQLVNSAKTNAFSPA
jgi:hypothetical protein